MVLVFGVVGNISAATINFDDLTPTYWVDSFKVQGVWFETPDWPYGFCILDATQGYGGCASPPQSLGLNYNYNGGIGPFTVTFPHLVNFVQITGGDRGGDSGDRFSISAYDSSGEFLLRNDTGPFGGNPYLSNGKYYADVATISVSVQGIKSVVIECHSTSGGVTYDDLKYEYENVPIPSAVWLLGSGLIALLEIRRKLRK